MTMMVEEVLHDGAVVITYSNRDGELHRDDGPAYESVWPNGDYRREWYVGGVRHRSDGPAVSEFRHGVRVEKYYLEGNPA